ncbi:hypothetical protein ACQI4F_02430 [Mycolicibacterium vaccae]|uniref:hypothetical protein n=1 Tax=Mycolicibacterium vaccae TaxID=1810 RepID=UPI003CF042EC
MTEPRPETDDYDLLTFGEVAARLSEELAQATEQLAALRGQTPENSDGIRSLEERITLLRAAADRYRQEQNTSEAFTRRFGPLSNPPSGSSPEWR